jgi:hypothetical protein
VDADWTVPWSGSRSALMTSHPEQELPGAPGIFPAAMRNPVYLAAIILLTGSVSGGMALGNYATGNWKSQQSSLLDMQMFEDDYTAPVASEVALTVPDVAGPHVCQGCDAGRHLRARYGAPDAYEDRYGAYEPAIAPDAYEVEPDWGGGRPVRAEAADYRVIEPDGAAPVASPEHAGGAGTVAAATAPPRLPALVSVASASAPN